MVRLGERVGLLYLDAHADLNVPDSVPEGALDWMGLAHMLGVAGAAPELVGAAGPAPLLAAEQVVVLGWNADRATAFERDQIATREAYGTALVRIGGANPAVVEAYLGKEG